ncbi:MAG: metal-dependent hydrolase [ANME-2 cluster archaeon]|nr:MAG: metal-dependent hydrolase [ANME-2 cluster archaeon]
MSVFPITDHHMHLDPRFQGVEAAKAFQRAGGTHIFLVSKPSWTIGITIDQPGDYRLVFDETVKMSEDVKKAGITAFPVLGVHPAAITKMYGRVGLDKTIDLMRAGLDMAAKYVEEGLAVGLKSGRPHYEVEPVLWDASNELLLHAMELARDAGCPLQLHTETATLENINDIAGMAKKVGLSPEKVIKHFAPPMIQEFEKCGMWPGVLAGKGMIEEALSQGDRFMMETDYIDDPERPGAVLGPKTIPRKTLALTEEWGDEIFWKIHKENPEKVYGVEIELP